MDAFLFGSSVIPSMVWIGESNVQLGDIVRRAKAKSGLTTEGWNDLDQIEREMLLVRMIYQMRDESR
jgi:hypothetical protein